MSVPSRLLMAGTRLWPVFFGSFVLISVIAKPHSLNAWPYTSFSLTINHPQRPDAPTTAISRHQHTPTASSFGFTQSCRISL
jgi:hypothetical protein